MLLHGSSHVSGVAAEVLTSLPPTVILTMELTAGRTDAHSIPKTVGTSVKQPCFDGGSVVDQILVSLKSWSLVRAFTDSMLSYKKLAECLRQTII